MSGRRAAATAGRDGDEIAAARLTPVASTAYQTVFYGEVVAIRGAARSGAGAE